MLAIAAIIWRSTPQPERADAAAAPPAVPVVAGTAERRDVPIFLDALGTVQAYYTVTVRSRIDGQIMQVLYREGEEVKAGAPLLQIDPRPFQAALEQAQAALERDEAQLKGAELNLARYAELVKPGFQTRQSYDDQKALVGQLQGTIKADQAQIDAAKLSLAYADIRAPIDGRVGARLVDPGNIVQAAQGTPLVTITLMKPIYVAFPVPQQRIAEIREQQAKGSLAVLALGTEAKTELAQGVLTLINNQVDTASGTIELKGTFKNEDERLWPGEFVDARLRLDERKDATTVAAEAVMRGPNGDFVFVIKPGDTVERRAVQVAMTEDGIAVIGKGITAGERVVIDGQYRLTDGAKVNIVPAPGAAGS